MDILKQAQEFQDQLEQYFQNPAPQDQEDFQILIRRALRGDDHLVVKSLILLDQLARQYKHETYTPEFYDLISDQDLFNWLEETKDKKILSEFDKGYISYIRQDLQAFQNGNIFN